jgi:hypothetical protein
MDEIIGYYAQIYGTNNWEGIAKQLISLRTNQCKTEITSFFDHFLKIEKKMKNFFEQFLVLSVIVKK